MKILAKREAKKATGFINEDPGEVDMHVYHGSFYE